MKIAVAGANGFIGARLVESLKKNYKVIALSRTQQASIDGVEARKCDLFSLLDAEKALEGADVAFYLVHSMLPTEKLSQGNFADHDLIAADNFARACKKNNIKQIIYLSGIIPNEKTLSLHLQSRFEVEKTLASSGVPLTTLRSGLILGPRGSTATILFRLVERLPMLACPSWALNATEAIFIDDVVKLLEFSILKEALYDKSFDIGTKEVVTYKKLMQMAAESAGKNRVFVDLPWIPPIISQLWVSVVTGAPQSLTAPIIESLQYPITAADHSLQEQAHVELKSLKDSLDETFKFLENADNKKDRPRAFVQKGALKSREVRSVQRLYLPEGMSVEEVSKYYLEFLSTLFLGMIHVEVKGNVCRFILSPTQICLLELELSEERSFEDRKLFYITGGILNKKGVRERLEFRIVKGANVLLAGLHEYQPQLPWWIYTLTQAHAHSWVMSRFSNFLEKKIKTKQ